MSSEARSVPNKKRAAEESLAAPTAKRSNSESTDQREAFRSSIRHTYSSFQVLSSEKPQEPGNTQRAYKQLLSAASGRRSNTFFFAVFFSSLLKDLPVSGDAPSRRLAVRLLPRFASQFPDLLEATASTLSGVAATDLTGSDSKAKQEERLAALEALSSLLAVCCQWHVRVQQIMGLFLW